MAQERFLDKNGKQLSVGDTVIIRGVVDVLGVTITGSNGDRVAVVANSEWIPCWSNELEKVE